MPRQISKLHGTDSKSSAGSKGGRPRGTGPHQELRERLLRKYGITPLEYMMKVLSKHDWKFKNPKKQDAHDAKVMWAAEKAAPYFHAKLNNVELSTDDDGDEVDGLKIVFVKAKVAKK